MVRQSKVLNFLTVFRMEYVLETFWRFLRRRQKVCDPYFMSKADMT